MDNQQSPKPKYIGDLEDARTALDQQRNLIDEIQESGYERTYQRWGGERRKIDQFLTQFQRASEKELAWARSEILKKRVKIQSRIDALVKN
jgi:hypothetical protein